MRPCFPDFEEGLEPRQKPACTPTVSPSPELPDAAADAEVVVLEGPAKKTAAGPGWEVNRLPSL